MGKVIYNNSISLDGYVAGPNDGPELGLGEGGERLFYWYQSGDTELPLPGTDMKFMVSKASAEHLKQAFSQLGSGIAGRRMFDIAHGWGGHPPGGGHYFIMTHNPPKEWMYEGSPFTFVTDGIESAVKQAKAVAGDKHVAISSASIAQQCLAAGLLDEIHLDLTPYLLGGGVHLFERLGKTPIDMEIIHVIEGHGVTHMAYRIVK